MSPPEQHCLIQWLLTFQLIKINSEPQVLPRVSSPHIGHSRLEIISSTIQGSVGWYFARVPWNTVCTEMWSGGGGGGLALHSEDSSVTI